MLTSIALILILGLLASSFFNKLKLPGLIGLILLGIALGPHALNLIDDSLLMISGDVRQIALVIILTRAGLSLNLEDLKKAGRPGILMCFIPACIEIVATIVLAMALFGVSLLDAAIMGSVIAAVSPAVVVPRMIRLMEEGYGKSGIPQLILAGASVDDVFVIVLFTMLITFASSGEIHAASLFQVPLSIALGALLGIGTGFFLVQFFQKFHMRDSIKVLLLLSAAFLFLEIQYQLEDFVLVSGLIAVMSMGMTIHQQNVDLSKRLSVKFNKLWLGAEIFLFVLVGVAVDLKVAFDYGGLMILLIGIALLFRMLGVYLSLLKTHLNLKERLFCMLSYTPKATVQAAIGTIPISMGLACGELVLTASVLSILITAPLGAICIDNFYHRLIEKG